MLLGGEGLKLRLWLFLLPVLGSEYVFDRKRSKLTAALEPSRQEQPLERAVENSVHLET
jgi:hypothetical protein